MRYRIIFYEYCFMKFTENVLYYDCTTKLKERLGRRARDRCGGRNEEFVTRALSLSAHAPEPEKKKKKHFSHLDLQAASPQPIRHGLAVAV